MPLYHYCAKKEEGKKVITVDGVWKTRHHIEDMADYTSFKKDVIPPEFGEDPEGWMIISLAIIG